MISTIDAGRTKEGQPSAPRRTDSSTPRSIRSRARSAAQTATSIPPSTACSGISNRTDSACDIVDNRLLEDLKGTEPFKWNGGNPNLPTECGPRTEKYFWRSENYSTPDSDRPRALSSAACRRGPIAGAPRRRTHAAAGARQGHLRARQDKFGKPIPQNDQCSYCHSGPKGTNQKSFDVGTGKATDHSPIFDTPQLTNIALTAPYLHDGSARTLEEIWTVFNPKTSTAAPTT